MYCNKCGSEIPQDCDFCLKCGAPTVQRVQQTVYTQNTPEVHAQKNNVYGNFGGLIISGALILLLLIIGAVVLRLFLSGQNIVNVFRIAAVMLPVGFAAALTIRTKGLDLSFVAMAALSSVIIINAGSLGAGIVLALIICIVIGSINAVAIHFLKLPGVLVTLAMMLVVSFAAVRIGAGMTHRPIDAAPAWVLIVVLAAAVIALAIAFLTSQSGDPKKQLWANLLPVYAGSGVLAVLYTIAFMVRVGAVTYLAPQIFPIVLIGVFLATARFHQNKTLGIAFSVVPVLMYVLLNNVLNIAAVNVYFQSIIIFVIIAVMIGVIGNGGRAALAGHDIDAGSLKTVVALVPLLVYLLLQGVYMIGLAAMNGRMAFGLMGTVAQLVLLLITIGFAVWYSLAGSRGAQPGEYNNDGGPAY